MSSYEQRILSDALCPADGTAGAAPPEESIIEQRSPSPLADEDPDQSVDPVDLDPGREDTPAERVAIELADLNASVEICRPVADILERLREAREEAMQLRGETREAQDRAAASAVDVDKRFIDLSARLRRREDELEGARAELEKARERFDKENKRAQQAEQLLDEASKKARAIGVLAGDVQKLIGPQPTGASAPAASAPSQAPIDTSAVVGAVRKLLAALVDAVVVPGARAHIDDQRRRCEELERKNEVLEKRIEVFTNEHETSQAALAAIPVIARAHSAAMQAEVEIAKSQRVVAERKLDEERSRAIAERSQAAEATAGAAPSAEVTAVVEAAPDVAAAAAPQVPPVTDVTRLAQLCKFGMVAYRKGISIADSAKGINAGEAAFTLSSRGVERIIKQDAKWVHTVNGAATSTPIARCTAARPWIYTPLSGLPIAWLGVAKNELYNTARVVPMSGNRAVVLSANRALRVVFYEYAVADSIRVLSITRVDKVVTAKNRRAIAEDPLMHGLIAMYDGDAPVAHTFETENPAIPVPIETEDALVIMASVVIAARVPEQDSEGGPDDPEVASGKAASSRSAAPQAADAGDVSVSGITGPLKIYTQAALVGYGEHPLDIVVINPERRRDTSVIAAIRQHVEDVRKSAIAETDTVVSYIGPTADRDELRSYSADVSQGEKKKKKKTAEAVITITTFEWEIQRSAGGMATWRGTDRYYPLGLIHGIAVRVTETGSEILIASSATRKNVITYEKPVVLTNTAHTELVMSIGLLTSGGYNFHAVFFSQTPAGQKRRAVTSAADVRKMLEEFQALFDGAAAAPKKPRK
jgi:hypothetical protein